MSEGVLASELRLALAMRGGVSLSVWIGGAVREIERFRTDVILGSPDPNGWARSSLAAVGRAAGYTRVQVDVLSGASAGGLNAVILGTAMSNGRKLDKLRDVWLDAAAIEKLVYKSSHAAQNSILRGDYFLNELENKLDELLESEQSDGMLAVDRVDVFLSVTSVVSNQLSAVLDPTAPVTEQRIDGQIHLRKRGALRNEFERKDIGQLARAARSTAAFPVAFEPLRIEPDDLEGNVDFRPTRPSPLFLFDGGVTDNMPVGKAARAISSAPADGPTARLLLYLHPSPGVPSAKAAADAVGARKALRADGARPFDVIKATLRSLRGKSLLEDLQAIEAHNDSVEQQLLDRDRLLAPVDATTSLERIWAAVTTWTGLDPPSGSVPFGESVVAPELDATRLVGLFATPWEHVAEHLPPVEVSPQAGGRNGDELHQLTRVLTRALRDVSLPRAARLPVLSRNSLRPWGAIIRVTSLLIEWSQCGAEDAVVVEHAGQRKRELYELRDDAVRKAADLNVATLRHTNELSRVDSAASSAIVLQRTPLVRDQLAQVEQIWNKVVEIAAELSEVLPRVDPDEPRDVGDELRRTFERLLLPKASTARVKQALDRIDVALLPLHRGEPKGSLERIRYLTISGNAGTPLAECFHWPDTVREPAPRFATVRPLPTGAAGGGLAFDTSRSDASSKLAGNQLHNFAAFLERSWRANDWMWGQMDAAATIVDLVLDPVRIAQMANEWRRYLADSIHVICTQPLKDDENNPHEWSGAVVEMAERLWTDDVVELVRDELQSVREGSPVPPLTRALLLWRRHVEIAAIELDCDQENSPTGQPKPDNLSEGMGQWDAASRSLEDRWGERQVTALGMRAVFVGWRALFARVSLPLSAVRPLLAPILAPLAGFFLCRRRTSFALEVFLFGCIAPRVVDSGAGQIVVGALAVAIAAAWLLITRDVWVDDQGKRHKRFDLFTDAWSLATLVVMVAVIVELVFVDWDWFARLLPNPAVGDRGVLPYVLPVTSVAIVTFVTWYWARLPWRLVVMVINGGIVVGWVALGSYSAYDQLGCWRWAGNAGSFWWALVAMVLATTLVGYNIDVAKVDGEY